MGSNAAYGTVESQYEDISVPDKPRDEPIYVLTSTSLLHCTNMFYVYKNSSV